MHREARENDGLATSSITTNLQDVNYYLNAVWDTTRYTDWQKEWIGSATYCINVQVPIYYGNNSSLDDRLHSQLNIAYVNDTNNLPTSDFTSRISGLAPDAPAMYNNGGINWQFHNGAVTFDSNPATALFRSAIAKTDNLISNLTIGYEFLRGLQLTSSFGYNHDEMNQTNLTPGMSQVPPNNTNPNNRAALYATTTNTT